jgi:SAM-dependent methyltransferase
MTEMANRYSRSDIVAWYIENEWGDFVLSNGKFPDGKGDPFAFQSAGTQFYSRVAELLSERTLNPRRVMDVGSASGRMLRELIKLYARADEFVGCEPSPVFTALARSILFSNPPMPKWFSITATATGRRLPVFVEGSIANFADVSGARSKVDLVNCGIEDLPRPKRYFDLITCLNVVDRHPAPLELVGKLCEALREGGTLCLASPLDWKDSPANSAQWVDCLTSLLPGTDWTVQKDVSVDYVFRVSERQVVHYKSQVVVATKVKGLS